MKSIYTKMRTWLKKTWKKEYILWLIVAMWSLIFWEGHRILPGAKWLSEVIPPWIVILNLMFLFTFTTMLINKRHFSKIGAFVTLTLVLVTWVFFSIGYKRLPLLSIIVPDPIPFMGTAL